MDSSVWGWLVTKCIKTWIVGKKTQQYFKFGLLSVFKFLFPLNHWLHFFLLRPNGNKKKQYSIQIVDSSIENIIDIVSCNWVLKDSKCEQTNLIYHRLRLERQTGEFRLKKKTIFSVHPQYNIAKVPKGVVKFDLPLQSNSLLVGTDRLDLHQHVLNGKPHNSKGVFTWKTIDFFPNVRILIVRKCYQYCFISTFKIRFPYTNRKYFLSEKRKRKFLRIDWLLDLRMTATAQRIENLILRMFKAVLSNLGPLGVQNHFSS